MIIFKTTAVIALSAWLLIGMFVMDAVGRM